MPIPPPSSFYDGYPRREHIRCPSCREVVMAEVTFNSRDPFPSYIHFCDCGYTIIESEWEPVAALDADTLAAVDNAVGGMCATYGTAILAGLDDIEPVAMTAPAAPRPRAWPALLLWVLAGVGSTIAALVLSRLLGAL